MDSKLTADEASLVHALSGFASASMFAAAEFAADDRDLLVTRATSALEYAGRVLVNKGVCLE